MVYVYCSIYKVYDGATLGEGGMYQYGGISGSRTRKVASAVLIREILCLKLERVLGLRLRVQGLGFTD